MDEYPYNAVIVVIIIFKSRDFKAVYQKTP